MTPPADSPLSINDEQQRRPSASATAIKICVLLGLTVWAYWPEFRMFADVAAGSGDWAHGLVLVPAVLLLVYLRRGELAASLGRGSIWGVLLLLFGLAVYAASTWPFDYGYPRDASVVPVAAGIVLAVGGWRVLKLCLPMLLLLWLSIPLGQRAYSAVIIRPETYTLAATRAVLDQLPGVEVTQSGPDLNFTRGDVAGTVALGEPRRGASLLVTYVVIGVFVVFTRIRPFWQVALVALAAGPISLFCNWLRIVCWGLIAVYTAPDPTSSIPRMAATTCSLLWAYAFFGFGCWILSRLTLIMEDEEDEGEDDAADGLAARE